MVDELVGLGPEPPVVAKDMMGRLVERLLGVVADADVGEPGDRCGRLPVGREGLADARRDLRHRLASPRAEDEAVADPDRTLDRLRLTRAHPDRRLRLLHRWRAEHSMVVIRLARVRPDLANSRNLT